MSAYSDDLLAARLAAMAPEPMQDDWLDVRRRARDRRRRTLVLAALAAAFIVVLVGCTAVFGPRVVSFADSEPAPPEAIEWLEMVQHANAITNPGAPGFDPQQTRRLVDETFRGGTLAIELTPTEDGFCVSLQHAGRWGDGSSTDCVTAERRRREPVVLTEVEGRGTQDPTIAGEVRQRGATSLVGWTTAPGAAGARVRFEDGTGLEVEQFFRVTEPIDAAFFVVEIPEEHTHFPRRAVELIVRDADGAPIAQQAIAYGDPDEWTFPRFGRAGFPPAADASRARLLRFPGTQATVRIAPATGGVTCYRFDVPRYGGSEGCLRDDAAREQVLLDRDALFPGPGSGPDHPVVLWGLVELSVRRVELRFQDGTRSTIAPTGRFVVYEISTQHHAPGTRLVSARLLNAEGRIVRRIAFDPATRDLYPCTDPVDPGLGPRVCP